MEKKREILYYEDYFIDFFMSLDDGAKKKFLMCSICLKRKNALTRTSLS